MAEFAEIQYRGHKTHDFPTKITYKTKYIWSDDVDKPWKETLVYVKNEDEGRKLIFAWNDYRHVTLKLPRGKGHHYIFIKSEQV